MSSLSLWQHHTVATAPMAVPRSSAVGPRASRRLRNAARARATSDGYSRGRIDAALDVAAVSCTFDNGIVWSSEAVNAAMGTFDPRTVAGGLADWTQNVSEDVRDVMLNRLENGVLSTDEVTVTDVARGDFAISEAIANKMNMPRLAVMDEIGTVEPDAAHPETDGGDDER